MSVEQQKVSLDDLDYFWMPNGAPCFTANRPDICEVVESLGFQIYYLLGNHQENKTVDGKDASNKPIKYTVSTNKASLLKVVNNLIGRSITESDDPFPSEMFCSIESEAYYSMPKIPLELINKLDEFFRLVDAQHGTESIVILTFDPNKNDSSGWGVLVPDQTNTSVHCKYDADSIAEIKPEHVLIAGSVHSHPNMPAYASGTDHADQADFDGLHITFGWQKSVNGGATQFHAEMQLSGSAFVLDINDVIEANSYVKDPDPEVIEWTSKVKKVLPPYQAQPLGMGAQYNQTAHQTNQTHHREYTATTPGTSYEKNIPFSFEQEEGHIIAEVDFTSDNSLCPSCNYTLFETDTDEDSCCPRCDMPIASANWSLGQIEQAMRSYLISRNLDSSLAYYLWCTESDSTNPTSSSKPFLIQIKPDELDSNPSENGSITYPQEIEWDNYDSSDYSYNQFSIYNPNLTLCCRQNSDRAWVDCNCETTVYYEDLQTFETSFRDVEIYQKNTSCYTCAYQYNPECPAFRNTVIDYISYNKLPEIESIIPCENWVDFYKVTSDIDSIGEYIYERD